MKKINPNDCATGFINGHTTVYGLTKFEIAAIHFMSASIMANDHSIPQHMSEETAMFHAKSAIILAKAFIAEVNNNFSNTQRGE